MYEQTNGDIDNQDLFSCRVRVAFREGYIDANGFTQFYGVPPVQGTKFTPPVSGVGTASSNEFFALNATLTHEDNPNLEAHLNEFGQPFQPTYALSHRPNYFPNVNKKIAGGKYFICKDDNDFIFCFLKGSSSCCFLVCVCLGKIQKRRHVFTAVCTLSYDYNSSSAVQGVLV
jgi:hypothetical protein